MNISLSAFASENLVSRDGFGSPILRLNLVRTYGIPPEFRGGVHLFLLENPKFSEVSQCQKEKSIRLSGCPYVRFRHNKGPNHASFLAEPLRREKLSHRAPHTIVDALSNFELHRCCCVVDGSVREWGVLDPNLARTCPT